MITKDRIYRNFEVRAAEEDGLIVEGYAAKFESPTVLYEVDGIKYSEIIKRGAFTGAEMTDVVMNYNHDGKPVARTKNQTLQLIVNDVGLKVRADLGGTEEGRKLHSEIKGGYLDKMSFSFKVPQGGDNYVKETRTRQINQFKRIFDVAVVDIPAYDSTNIQARSYFKAEAEKELAEARERRKQKLRILLEV